MESTLTTRSRRLELIASFASYEDAQTLVDRLADEGFPIDKLTVVRRRGRRALYGLLSHVIFNRGQRNVGSDTGIQAGRYEALADESVADEALRRLGEGAGRRIPPQQ